jgi:hypothetical protein
MARRWVRFIAVRDVSGGRGAATHDWAQTADLEHGVACP